MPVPEGAQDITPGVVYESYDVGEVRPDLRSDTSPPVPTTPLADVDGSPLPMFDPRVTEAFNGLVFLGALTSTFSWLGHTFRLRTLTTDEVLAVGLLVKPYSGTIGEAKAYTTAMAAACLLSVDGQELPMPVGVGQGELEWVSQRFDYVRRNYFQSTVDRIYTSYLELEGTVSRVVEAMEKASGPTESALGSNANSDGPSDADSSQGG